PVRSLRWVLGWCGRKDIFSVDHGIFVVAEEAGAADVFSAGVRLQVEDGFEVAGEELEKLQVTDFPRIISGHPLQAAAGGGDEQQLRLIIRLCEQGFPNGG